MNENKITRNQAAAMLIDKALYEQAVAQKFYWCRRF